MKVTNPILFADVICILIHVREDLTVVFVWLLNLSQIDLILNCKGVDIIYLLYVIHDLYLHLHKVYDYK